MIGSCSLEVVSDSVLSTLFFFAVPVSHTKSQLPLFSKGKLVWFKLQGPVHLLRQFAGGDGDRAVPGNALV